jgi:hypothetical protein
VTDGYTQGLPDTLRLRVGQDRRVPLTGASGAGNRWRVHPQPLTEGAALVRVDVGSLDGAPAPPGGPPPDSTTAPEVLVVEARAAGAVEVELRLGRSWEPDHPLAVHRVRVVVEE